MKYSEHKELLEFVKNKLQPGVTFDNKNINGTTIHTVTENDRFAMHGKGIALCIDGRTDKLIIIYKDKLADIVV